MWAAGNGRTDDDNCAADGFINFVGTIAISSVSQRGVPTFFGERCTAIFAVTYSGNTYDEAIVSIESVVNTNK